MAFRNPLSRPVPSIARKQPQARRLIPTDKADSIARPTTVERTWAELEGDALSASQRDLFKADAEHEARGDSSRQAALEPYRAEAAFLVEHDRPLVESAARYYQRVADALSPWRRRKGSGWAYRLRACALFAGEVMGPANAAILFGDIPLLAVIQAVSAGAATVTAGLVGAEFKHLQLSAERHRDDPDCLDDALQPYRHLFDGSGQRARRYATIALGSGLTVGLLVAIAILSLRSAVDSFASGTAFGALAFAVTIASFINSYCHADQVSDLIDDAHAAYKKELRAHRRLPLHVPLLLSGRATDRTRSIHAERHHRGDAAAAHLHGQTYQTLIESPDVVGHGPAAPAIGRTLRKDPA
ncbi:hypothetical protein [Rhodococcus sp. IEGM 1330]|uniref:hypothetical protein n=1 Tax=Rhodococcus sp. IEGM 1330 TaxID=3082225 RepID=UPI0029532400|nr:hypothetical protein [Rhodococcus sp. IEGM 1330]MDV8022216.1 hypothetical protein [Rhodococcus sp. IEGM 1330]